MDEISKPKQKWRNGPIQSKTLNPLSANPTKWSNTLKQFVGNLPTNWVFDHFVKLALKGLINASIKLNLKCFSFKNNKGFSVFVNPSHVRVYSFSTFSVSFLVSFYTYWKHVFRGYKKRSVAWNRSTRLFPMHLFSISWKHQKTARTN